MKNAQLFEALKSLSKSEFREFGKFVSSPYHNNRTEVVKFYDAVKKFFPSFDSKELTEQRIFNEVYPGKKFSMVVIRKVISLTLNLLMDYYAIAGFKESPLDYNVKLLHKLHQKNLPRMFEKRSKSTDKLFLNAKHGHTYYEWKLSYTSLLVEHLRVNNNEKAMINKMQEELDIFMEFFLTMFLYFSLSMQTWSNLYNLKYDLKFYDQVLKFISGNDFSEYTLISLYYNALMLLKTEEEIYFFDLQKAGDKFEDKLSGEWSTFVYAMLTKYCKSRVEKGDIKYEKFQLEITKSYLKKNLYLKVSGYFEPYMFSSIVSNAADNKAFKWAEEFMNNFKQYLNPKTIEEVINYSSAILEFKKGNYKKSLKCLSVINPESLTRKLTIKNLSIMNYYELGYTEELISQIDAYKHFLQRDKSAAERLKQRDTNFIRFVSALVKIKFDENSELAIPLKKKIEETPYFNLKAWLLKKAEDLCK